MVVPFILLLLGSSLTVHTAALPSIAEENCALTKGYIPLVRQTTNVLDTSVSSDDATGTSITYRPAGNSMELGAALANYLRPSSAFTAKRSPKSEMPLSIEKGPSTGSFLIDKAKAKFEALLDDARPLCDSEHLPIQIEHLFSLDYLKRTLKEKRTAVNTLEDACVVLALCINRALPLEIELFSKQIEAAPKMSTEQREFFEQAKSNRNLVDLKKLRNALYAPQIHTKSCLVENSRIRTPRDSGLGEEKRVHFSPSASPTTEVSDHKSDLASLFG